jgi:hypothetical protein
LHHAFQAEHLLLIDREGMVIDYFNDDIHYKDLATPVLHLIVTESVDRSHKDFLKFYDKRFKILKKERKMLDKLVKIKNLPNLSSLDFEKLVKNLPNHWPATHFFCDEFDVKYYVERALCKTLGVDLDVCTDIAEKVPHCNVQTFLSDIEDLCATVFDALVEAGSIGKTNNEHYYLPDLAHIGLRVIKVEE